MSREEFIQKLHEEVERRMQMRIAIAKILVQTRIEPLFNIDGKTRRRMRRKKLRNNHQ